MPQLKHSKVYRGGAKAPSLSLETSKCSASVGSPDGRLLLSGSRDKTVKVWDVTPWDQKLKEIAFPNPSRW